MKAIRDVFRQFANGTIPDNLNLRLLRYEKQMQEGETQARARENAIKIMEQWQPPTDYSAAKTRHISYLKSIGATLFTAQTTSPLLCGFDHNTVLGFGLAFLEPWGVPFLPGSSIKGSASTWLSQAGCGPWAGRPESRGDASAQLFGGKFTNGDTVSGGVNFLDAWWEPNGQSSPFMTDIVTPHHTQYYEGNRWPDGMENPVPFNFPAIKPGAKFVFALRGPDAWAQVARQILENALQEQGIGAKTRIGYGRFKNFHPPQGN